MHHLITKYAPKPEEEKGLLSVLIECDETERLFIGRISWNIFEEYMLNIFSSAGFVELEDCHSSAYFIY